MALNEKKNIEEVIISSLRNKLKNYKPESNNMPFHYRLLGKDRMALYSFIQSLNTTFGTSIFEPVAVAIAKEKFKKVEKQFVLGDTIKEGCQQAIQKIMNKLTVNGNPNKKEEIELIRKAANSNSKTNLLKTVKVDLFLENFDGRLYFLDLKTAKPNISNFKDFKRTLLEWVGIILTNNPDANVNTLIAIPYNPYEPQPYERWTIKGMLDDTELMVGKEFWDFLGGKGSYEDLLICFEQAGIKLRTEIDEYFARFKNI